MQRTNKCNVEINSLQRLIAQKELQIQEGRIALQAPTANLEKVSIELQHMTREHDHVKKQ